MSFSDMLFNNTHSVEELVDIKKQKKVDKILLKVIRTVRSRGELDGWVKPEANFKTDLKLSDKVIFSIKKALSDYYGIDLTKNGSLMTSQAIVNYIKTNKPNVADSIFLVDYDEQEVDTHDEVQMIDVMEDPNVLVPRPTEKELPVPTKDPEPQEDPSLPSDEPIVDNPNSDELQPTPEETEGSTPDETPDAPVTDPIPEEDNVEASTEGVTASMEAYSNPALKGKMVWTYYTRDKAGISEKMITVGAGPNSRYICQVFPTKEQLISNQTKDAHAPHTVPYALGIPFNYIKKYLGRDGKMVLIKQRVKVPVAICVIDKIPMERYSFKQVPYGKYAKEGLETSTEGLSSAPATTETWADVMNNL